METHSENRLTTIRLHQAFNLFNPKVYRYLLIIGIFFAVSLIFMIAKEIKSLPVYVLSMLMATAFYAVWRCLHSPQTITLGDGTAEFDDYVYMRPEFGHSRSFLWLKVSYTVSDIEKFEFHQNAIEKLFDVGHVSFKGKARFTAKRDLDRIQEKDTFYIWGIRHFSRFRSEFSSQKIINTP